jgi:hypothetical protein
MRARRKRNRKKELKTSTYDVRKGEKEHKRMRAITRRV